MHVSQCKATGEVIFNPQNDEEHAFIQTMIDMMERGGTLSVQLREKTITLQFAKVYNPMGLKIVGDDNEQSARC